MSYNNRETETPINRAQSAIEEALHANQQLINLDAQTQQAVGGASELRETFPVDENLTPPRHSEVSEAVFNQAVNKLIAEAGHQVQVTSGKRSTARQAELWQEALQKYGDPAIARKWVAPPGKSKHEIGLAKDLKFASDAVRDWVHGNAARFGLHFPLDNEPWHIEPIGSR